MQSEGNVSGVGDKLNGGQLGPRATTLEVGVLSRVWTSGFKVRCILVRYVSTPSFVSIGVQTCTLRWRVTPRHFRRSCLPSQVCLRMYLRGRHGVGSPPPLGHVRA